MNYIGKTGKIAQVLFKQTAKLKSASDPCERRLLFTGVPGVGKTDLAEHLAAELSGESFERVHANMAVNVWMINGQSCSIEVVRKWQELGIYRPMFGDCRVVLVDEIDAISTAALQEIRTYLDRLPLATVFIATTNKTTAELQEQLQSRFQVFYFDKIPMADIANWLVQNLKIPSDAALRIATGSNGNVRAAKMDALAWTSVIS